MIRENKPRLLNRLSRLEGQVRGIAGMIQEDRYCIDILTQLQAARAAIRVIESEMLKEHIDHCVSDAILSGDEADRRVKTAELVKLLERATK